MQVRVAVNNEDLPMEAFYRDEDVRNIFVPLLKQWTRRVGQGGRTIVYLAAPPGLGKTTLALFLHHLATHSELVGLPHDAFAPLCLEVRGIDGFHYPNSYLDSHVIEEDGVVKTLRQRKGAPFTYDVGSLHALLKQARAGGATDPWPTYSRVTHDVALGTTGVTGNVLLLEGNYLLLPEEPWASLTPLADVTLFVRADESLLKDRLIGRKVQGGMSRDQAEAWYEASDGPNVRMVLARQRPADLELVLQDDGSFLVQKGLV